MQNKKIAILIFANSAEKEAIAKPFFKSEEVFLELNKQILRKVKNTGIPYFWLSENEQVGHSFGERYTNALQFVYEQGYENVIAIGNDSPNLQTKDILLVAEKLHQKKIILGPSKDGGFYLLGIQKQCFNKAFLLTLPWQSSKLRNCITEYFYTNNIDVTFLKPLKDLDTVPDIKDLICGYKKLNTSFLKLLHQIFFVPTKIWISPSFFSSTNFKATLFNKGSPLYVFIFNKF